jgi:peptidyl-prolyl cis-trans isomerase SurA
MRFLALFCTVTFLFALSPAAPAMAEDVAVTVNGEPITVRDIEQRMRWELLTSGSFGERMKEAIVKQALGQPFVPDRQASATPIRSLAEAQEQAESIKRKLVDAARRQVLAGSGGGAWEAAIEAMIRDRLVLQAAKKFDIEIADEDIEKSLAQRLEGRTRAHDPAAFYLELEDNGIGREAVRVAVRARLAWRDVIRSVYGNRKRWGRYGMYTSFARGYLDELRRQAVVEYRG